MKNELKYYYGLEVVNIHQKDKKFYFKYDNYEYIFIQCDLENIDKIYEMSNDLIQKGIYCHQIILNNINQIITNINNENYVLMKVYVPKTKINLNEIINFNNINYSNNQSLKIAAWYDLWTKKVDYFEYQISQMGKKYPLIRKSFSYYIGLAENAISIVKSIPQANLYYSLGHRRINFKDTLEDLYNPFNFIIDLRIRDICEYFKNCFFNKVDIENEIFMYLSYNNLNYNESSYFLARMIFPTYYFDTYEKIINNDIDEIKINNIISLVNDYEMLLKKIYSYLRNRVNLPTLEWLTN